MAGSWNIATGKDICTFAKLPPNPVNGEYTYGLLFVSANTKQVFDEPCQQACQEFERDLVKEGRDNNGLHLKKAGNSVLSSDRYDDLCHWLQELKNRNPHIVFVILDAGDFYKTVKLIADGMGLVTQCLKLKNVVRLPRGYFSNLLLKVNTKLGGTNHTLASRLPRDQQVQATHVYQDPPGSLSWLFDEVR